MNNQPVTPKPVSYAELPGSFTLGEDSAVAIKSDTAYQEIERTTGAYLADLLDIGIAVSGDIVLLHDETMPADESYVLTVTEEETVLKSGSPEGLFRAAQTLRQLFPPDGSRSDKSASIRCAEIHDAPAYPYRGLMIDVARHFFPKEVIMRQIDLAALYKLNKLHLHLTDDQGWRIEIKSRPALTEIGGQGAVGGAPGGFYTQEDYKEIVAYAAARYIEVIPEIDMPGHVNAALMSIPELNPDGVSAEQRTDTEVGVSTLQCRSEATYAFCDDVIREMASLTPSRYIHIGGDEAHITAAEDYDYFIARVCETAKKYGKTTIGWNPYDRAEIFPGSVLQNWDRFPDREEGDKTNYAAQKKMSVILSPAGAYLDMKYNEKTARGLMWRGPVNLERSYDWTLEETAPDNAVIDIESTIWTETILTQDDMDYMLYPRLIANAEVGWTKGARDFSGFTERLAAELKRLDALGVKYCRDYE
ncbi:MAG: beta-N-acetylhexosaminidase [Clostridiales bacterium]|nr:beta-N-acetylhexosaminidase [Clostridiales bacterium]